jgi:glycosyltransferase involved in cell wall biosynthesis
MRPGPPPLARSSPRRILIVTDAWHPQVNGVVRTLETVAREMVFLGHQVRFATPEHAAVTLPLPTYSDIRLALFPRRHIARIMDEYQPDAVHIATEGTMGLAARAICLARARPFTTSFHTRFPAYIHKRFPLIPEGAIYRVLRRFHAPAQTTMATTPALRRELESHGFRNVVLWSRGVDSDLFKPGQGDAIERRIGRAVARPVFLYVGRLATEKNVEAFLDLDLPGAKVVVGDGPQQAELQRRYGDAHFLGRATGADLAAFYASSDVFVFPSRTDTFGLVILEALASGLPVAGYQEATTLDIVGNAPIAALANDLREACLRALKLRSQDCRAFALRRTWRTCAEQFLENLACQSGSVREMRLERA